MHRIVNTFVMGTLALAVGMPTMVSAADISSLTTQQIIDALGGDADLIGGRHRDDNDPTTEGFPIGSSTAGAPNSGNTHWDLQMNATGNYRVPTTALGSGDFTLTVVGRLFANPSNKLNLLLTEPTADQSTRLKVAVDMQSFSDEGAADPKPTYNVDLTQEHVIQVVSVGGVRSAYVDGELAISNLTAAESIGFDGFEGWSPTNNGGGGQSNSHAEWRLWQAQSGVHIIPEPASMALLGLGGLALVARRRRA